MSTESSARLEEIRSAIRGRLRGVCEGWPDDVFEAMVDNLAALTLKYEALGSTNSYDRRSTDRLVDDMKRSIERNDSKHGEDD